MDCFELHQRGIARSCDVVGGIGDDQWSSPTPCEQWNVQDLVAHMTVENRWMLPLLDGATVDEVGDAFEGDLLGDDPLGAHQDAARAAQAKVDEADPDAVVHLSLGDTDTAFFLTQRAGDMVVHAWDLAVATGQDTAIDEAVAAALYDANVEVITDEVRASGIFGPEVPVDDDAPASVRLLGLLGRDPALGSMA